MDQLDGRVVVTLQRPAGHGVPPVVSKGARPSCSVLVPV